MDNRDDEEIQPYQFEPEWSPGELDTPEYSDNDTDTSDSSSDLEFGDVEPVILICRSVIPEGLVWFIGV